MAKIIGSGKIDWDKDRLFGSLKEFDCKKVAGFIFALERGYSFPNVEVARRSGDYYLCQAYHGDEISYGGHHRAIAHFISGFSFGFNLREEDKPKLPKPVHLIQNCVCENKEYPYDWYNYLRRTDAEELAKILGDDLSTRNLRFLDE